ncbi:E3 ubiquitin-protein ligase DCST1 [Schistosoma japonicum]|uniref:E3 ubiquitin-protein ligase DCST1 n=1 Tax=Schistosoma japonicum TaxID=6182 RepID=A0A4Z2CZA5_SCHJA|nr:E3 ubiquitin-protein ligase DCST1 [Schistosoma japonicum]
MYTFVTKYSIMGICLHVIRLTTYYVIYNYTQLRHSNKPIGIKPYSLMSFIFPFENRPYISNSQLLTACQSYWLIGQPYEKLKSQWLEKNMRIGWIFFTKGKHYVTFLRRMHFQKQCRQLSKFRQFLRYSVPTLEMIIYADGSDREKSEANMMYDGFIVRISRIICFFLFGLFISEFLLSTVIPTRNKATDLPSGDNKIPDEIFQRDAEILRSGVDWITKTFIRITITLAAVVSCRFRYLLLLIIPSLGQTIGLSYLGNELLHVSITGPVLNLEHNLRSTSESLICFIKLASNMTRDVSDFIEKSKETIEAEDDLNYIETIKAKSAQLKEKINQYNVSIQNLNIEIEKAKIMAKRAESFLVSSVNKTNIYAQLSMDMAKQAKDEMIKKAETSKANIISMMKDNHVNDSILNQIFNRIEDGLLIENSIEKRMQITCMVFFKTRSIICKQSSIKACSRLQTILIATTRYPILIKKMCLRKIASGVACPTNQALQNAVNQCSSSLSKIGFSSGFGSLFVQAQHDLYKFQQTFHFTIQHRLLQSEEIINWLNQNSGVIDRITQHTKDTIYVIFKLSFILTYLLRSLCLFVFYKAHRYITNYLLDLDYDNIYIETEFEHIDHKRSAESREALLPLKSYELNNVVWHQKKYTEAESKRVIQSLIKVIGFGFCMSLLFFIDFYMTELVQVLDEVTSTTFTIGNKQNNQSEGVKQTNTKQELNLLGDGIFTDLLRKTIKIVQHASNIDLLYDLSVCSPKAEFLGYEHFIHFCILWLSMIIICLLSGHMLRLRHKLLDFFYPKRSKYRVIHLYNELLVNRRRHMTTARNLLVHLSRQNRLQAEKEERSHRSLLCSMNSLLGNILRLNKMNCIVCMEKYAIGKGSLLYVCPYDGTAICQYCLTTLFNNHKVCITCLDRDYKRLEQINENVSTLKEIINNE